MTDLIPIKILIIEDSEDDVFFLMRHLKNEGYKPEYKQIETAKEFHLALEEPWDIIITDHTLPDFNSIEAITILNAAQKDIPLIVLSGTIDQSIAIESMRLGARDFIMKDETSRLIPAIERELKDTKNRKHSRQSEIKLKSDLQGLMDHSPALIYVKDLNGQYTFINEQGEKLFKIERNEIIGKSDSDLFTCDEAAMLEASEKKVLHEGVASEFEENLKINNCTYIFNSIKYPLFDDKGLAYAICGISTDITDKKQQEEKLRRSQKMEAIGQLSGGIAHDFNNQLGIVTGYLDFLKSSHAKEAKQLEWITNAETATFRCIDLTRQLLAFTRNKAVDTSAVNINSAFQNFKDMIKRSVTPQVDVVFSLSEDLWLTELDLGEFQDVILNLVINARDAMPKGGTLTIESKNVQLNEDHTLLQNNSNKNEYVQLIVSDTGTGMDSKTIEHVFEPFFTTKAVGKGTGLGLSMIYGFIQRYNGDISIYSELNIGTTFKISLPRSHKEILSEEETSTDNKVLPTGNESILIVDDEPSLLKLANIYLKGLGYKTKLAENASQALKILEYDAIDLMFSDVVMPGGMDGYELAKTASKLYPKLKIIMTSGFTSDSIESHKFISTGSSLLNKPYRNKDLAVQIRKSLDS